MSGGSSRSGSGQKWAKPIAQAAANTATGVFNANQDSLGQITGNVQSLIPGLKQKYLDGNPTLGAASGYAQNVLGGDYLNSNPYIDQYIKSTGDDVTSRVNANFGSRGSFGGTAHTTALAKALADSENAARFGNYQQERGFQQQAMSSSPSLAAADYLGITPLLSAAQTGAELPYTGINNYTNNLAQLFNGGVQKQGSLSSITGMLGAAGSLMSGAGAMGAKF